MADATSQGTRRAGITVLVTDATIDALTRCLEGVLAGLGTHDRVVVLSDQHAALSKLLARHRRVQLEPHPRHQLGRRMAAELRSGARAVVVLSGDALVPTARNLDDLVSTAERSGAAGAAPLSNGAPWPQCPEDVPDHTDSRDAIRDAAALCSRGGRNRAMVASEISGPCVAVLPTAADALDRDLVDFDVRTLGRALSAQGLGLVIAQGVYIHTTLDLVLVSACMIMKDEADYLAKCLGTLKGFADEVVIYDTGSTDGSIELARAMGATVIEGYWDDDFARARNAARLACRGTWVLHIDADEEIEDPETAGPHTWQILASNPAKDLLSIPLRNLEGSIYSPVRNPQEMFLARLFRRRKGQWVGAIHEHPQAIAGGGSLDSAMIDTLNLLHSGYLNEIIEGRNKRERNLRIASTRLQELDDKSRVLFEHARSMVLAGDREGAIPIFRQAVAAGTNEMFVRGALEHGALGLIESGRYDEALEWLDELDAMPDRHAGVVAWFRARALLCKDDGAGAWALVEHLTDYNDRFSNNSEDHLEAMKAGAHRLMGNHELAAHHCVNSLAVNLGNAPAWRILSTLPDVPSHEFERMASLVPADRLTLALANLLAMPPDGVEPIMEAFWKVHPGHMAIVAFATDFVARCDDASAERWRRRITEAGIDLTSLPTPKPQLETA